MFRLEKNFFVKGRPALPPSPPVKGKILDTRFGLIHVQTRKKFLSRAALPPPSKGKIFWHQIWLDTCSDWKKNFCGGTPPRNSKKLLWLRGGRYASCVHAGGLSCFIELSPAKRFPLLLSDKKANLLKLFEMISLINLDFSSIVPTFDSPPCVRCVLG